MFCKNCGTGNADGDMFCKNCGATLNVEATAAGNVNVTGSTQNMNAETYSGVGAEGTNAAFGMGMNNANTVNNAFANNNAMLPTNKKKKNTIIAAAVVVLLVLIVLFGGRSAKSTVNKFIKAVYKENAKTIVKLIPKAVLEEILDDNGYDDDEVDEYIDDLEDVLEYVDKDWEGKFKIVEIDKLSSKRLKELKEDYDDYYDVKISDARDVEVQLIIDDEKEEVEFRVVKVGRSWYIDVMTMYNMYY